MDHFLKENNKPSVFTWALAALALLIFAAVEAGYDNDFRIYLSASADIFQNKNIFTEHYKDGYHYFYSPLFAILISCFNFLPLYAAQFIWVVMNIFFLFRTWKIFSGWLNVSTFTSRKRIIFNALCFLFMIRFLRDNFDYGQVTILMLYLSGEGLNLIFRNKVLAGTALIALGINIKILPIVILPYLLYRREFFAAGMIIVFWMVFLLLPSLILGHAQNMFLITEWWHLIDPTNAEHIIDTEETSFHGLSTLLPTLLMKTVPDPHALALNRNILDLSVTTVSEILMIARAFFILLTFYFLRTLPFQKNVSPLHRFWEIAYLFLVVPLIFPHQQHYAFYMCLPATMYLLFFVMRSDVKQSGMKIALIAVGILFNANLFLGEFKPYYDHYKIVTYGALLMVILLMYARPSKIKSEV